jgi:hypothetical protein
MAAVRVASTALNNTPATCRKCYIHPQVFAAMESTELWKLHDAAHELTSRGGVGHKNTSGSPRKRHPERQRGVGGG